MKALQVNEKLNWKIFFGFGVLIFSYTFIRACVLSITWDEAYSYLEFVKKGIFIPSDFNTMSANNHLLNTWLDILIVKCFGVNEFVLRIPALIGHLLFLFYSAKLVRNFPVKGFALASFLVLNLNPYLLDFFSLSRGYGLSFGFMMGSIYFLQQFISSENKNRYATLSVLFASSAVLANFVLLNFCISIFLVLIFVALILNRREKQINATSPFSFIKIIFLPFLILISLLIFILPFIFKLKNAGALFYGGRIGFYTDTICETTHHIFYEKGNSLWIERIAKLFSVLIILTATIFSGLKFFKKELNANRLFLLAIVLIFISCALASVLEFQMVHVLYLTARTALYLVILITLIFVFLFSEILNVKSLAVFYFFITLIIIHFFSAMNFNYVLDWRSNADTKTMLHELDIIQQESAANPPSLISSKGLTEPEEFYKEINQLNWLKILPENEMRTNGDYLYLDEKDFSSYKKENPGCKTVKIFPVTGNVLVKQN